MSGFRGNFLPGRIGLEWMKNEFDEHIQAGGYFTASWNHYLKMVIFF